VILYFFIGLFAGFWLFGALFLFSIIVVWKLFMRRRRCRPQVFVRLYSGGKRMVKMNLKDSQQVTVSAVIEDAKGVAVTGAQFDAPPTNGLDDASFGAVTPAADGLSALFVPNGKQGICHIQFSASVGGKSFSGQSEDINVIPGDATQVVLSLGAPQDIPAPAAPAAPAP